MNTKLGKLLCMLNLHSLGTFEDAKGGGAWRCGRCTSWVSKANGKRLERAKEMENVKLFR